MSKEKEKEGFIERFLKYFFSLIFDKVEKEIKNKIYSYISDITRSVIKKIMLSVIGGVLVLAGILFICISTVNYLAIYTAVWMAWLIVGIIILLAGALITTLVLRRR